MLSFFEVLIILDIEKMVIIVLSVMNAADKAYCTSFIISSIVDYH